MPDLSKMMGAAMNYRCLRAMNERNCFVNGTIDCFVNGAAFEWEESVLVLQSAKAVCVHVPKL